jgi:tetratricopeptide (TPR) repeat protein
VLAEPANASRWAELAALLEANGLVELALEGYRGLVSVEPEDAQGWYHLGRLRAELGDARGATEAFDRSIEQHGGYAPSFWRKGQALLALGELEQAEGAFRLADTLAPDDPAGRFGLARVALQREEPALALEILDALAAERPEDGHVRQLRARALVKLGHPERAQALLDEEHGEASLEVFDPWTEASRADPATTLGKARRGEALIAAGRHAEALRVLEPLFRAEPGNTYLQGILLKALLPLGRHAEALAVLDESERAQPRHHRTALNRAVVLHLQGKPHEAIGCLEESVRLQPSNAAALVYLGQLQLELQRLPEAEVSLTRALTLGSRDLRLYTALVRVQLGLGQRERALATLRQGIRVHPRAPELGELRSSVEGPEAGR